MSSKHSNLTIHMNDSKDTVLLDGLVISPHMVSYVAGLSS
jgi:hypothetical protein